MNRLLLTNTLALLSISISAQNIEVKISNPEPRVGERIQLEVYFQVLDSILNQSIESSYLSLGEYDNPYLTKTITAESPGVVKISPISININNKTYTSRSLELNILPKLEKKEGIWVRVLNHNNKTIIILEEIRQANWEITKTKERGVDATSIGIPATFKTAELKYDPIPEISYNYLGSTTEILDKYDSKAKDKKPLVYTRKTYEVNSWKRKEYILDKSHFVNLPKRSSITPRKIKINWP